MVPGEVLLKFRPGATPSQVQAILADLGATRVRRFGRIKAEEQRITRWSVLEAVRRYEKNPAVEFIEPNWIVGTQGTPDDPIFGQQWGLRNSGQAGGVVGADIEATQAWDVQTGSPDVVVAIIDTGVDYTHPDLAPNIWTNPNEIPNNGIDDDQNGLVDDVHGFDYLNFDADPMDDNGHGTHVAGTVAAVGNNGIGVAGVAWNARIMPLKFLGPDGTGPISGAVACVEYAVSMGAQVLNNSWGGIGYSNMLRLAIEDANDAGVLFVAAAGNSGMNLDESAYYPASYTTPNMIPVASTTNQDLLSGFSNYGAQTVRIAAPGSNIWSTSPGAGYQSMSGTSMAAPHVSGALALLKSQFPAMPAAQLKTVLLSSAEPVPALAGLVGGGARLNVSRMLTGLDSIPPASIQNLALGQAGSNQVLLAWTATGDDGGAGIASRYDIRYDLSPINASNFLSAQAVSATPMPQAAGSAEEAVVSGLNAATTYYFAVKAIDEYGNASPISNVVSGRTLDPPKISLTPTSFSRSLLTGGAAETTLTVTNAAQGTLDFHVIAASPQAARGTAQSSMTLAKGESDPRVGVAVSAEQGGPDRFGHLWIDSRAGGGPPFQWTDISALGARLPLAEDDAISEPAPIGFSFPFYDGSFNAVRVCTNGFLSFSSDVAEFSNQPLPSASAPENLIAPLWDDLYFSPGSSAYLYSDGLRCIVQWTNVYHYGGGGPYTFQVILDRDGTITFEYLALEGVVNESTVGIQDATRGDGLTVAFNTSFLVDSLAVRITSVPRWLSASPISGTVGPGGSTALSVRFDAAGLPQGGFDADLTIASNDPDAPQLTVPVHLDVTAAPDITLGTTSLSFGNVFVGESRTQTVSVSNDGASALAITGVQATPADYQVDETPFVLEAGETRELAVRFVPALEMSAPGALTISSNDPDEGRVTVVLQGAALLPPSLLLSPTSLGASLITGASTTRSFEVRNVGASDLTWRIFAQGGSNTASIPVTLAAPAALGEPPDGARPPSDSNSQRIGSIEVELADLTGVRILFDRSHGSPGPSSWSTLVASLKSRGAVLTENMNPITAELLGDFDILWLTDATRLWSASEIAALVAWLRAGGSLLLEGDNPSSVDMFNGILSAVGAGIQYRSVSGTSGITTLVHPHPTTRGVLSINLEENIATLGPVVSPASVLIEDVSGVPNSAWSVVGSGKVLALADEVFSDFHSGYGDNQLFANQAFDWLGTIGWLRISPNSGVVPAGSSAAETVTLDATGLPAGIYVADLVLTSNDPRRPAASLSFALNVSGVPRAIEAVAAEIVPGTLAVGNGGEWITARVELPPEYDPTGIDMPSVRLQGEIPLRTKAVKLGDFNRNGIPDLELRFDRAAAESVLAEGDSVEVLVTGEVGSEALFTARGSIRVVHPRVTAPRGGEVYFAGSPVEIAWEDPPGASSPYANLTYSLDGGQAWSPLADHVTGDAYTWAAPQYSTAGAWIRVSVFDASGPLGSDMTDAPFTIRPTVTAVVPVERALPSVFALHQNAPNPFNPNTAIRFDLPSPGRTHVRVFSAGGRLVREWSLGLVPAGRHRLDWDGRDRLGRESASGVYFLKLEIEGERPFRASRTMLLLK